MAKESKFILRARKISPASLLESVLFSNPDHSKVSLNDMAVYHKLHHGITLTKQAIAKRFTKQATNFVKILLSQLLRSNLSDDSEVFTHSCFKRIKIKDSTCFQLPENMKDFYPGSGGSGSSAAVRIQFEYDLKNLEVLELGISAFNNQDHKNAKDTLDNIQADDLIIRDLGYISVGIQRDIEKRNAWYLCRLNHTTSVQDAVTSQNIDFVKIEKKMRQNGITVMEKEVHLSKEGYTCRLVIEIIPDHIKGERIRKREVINKKKGRKSSKEALARAGLNLFLTNCPARMLSASEVRRIYGIRWQIEIVFKAWKQNSQLHTVKKMDINRFEFLLYAKLVWVILHWKVLQVIDTNMSLNRTGRVSILKVYKALGQFRRFTISIIRGQTHRVKEFMEKLNDISTTLLKHEDRKDRINWRNVEII